MTTTDLAAAVARLRYLQPVLDGDTDMSEVRNDDIALVLSAIESAQQDARRYRWLRGQMVHEHCGPLIGWTIGTLLPGDDPDAAIDAAMGEGN